MPRRGCRRSARSLILVAGLVLGAASTTAASGGDVRGLWVDQRDPGKRKVGVWIEDCEGQLCGRIVWLRKPLSGGKPKRDKHNPEPRLRERPLARLMVWPRRRSKRST